MRIKTLLLLFLLASCTLEAQGYYLGVTGSLCASRITSSVTETDYFKVKNAPSANAGIYVERTLNRYSSVGAEALWVNMSGREGRENVPLFGYQNLQLVQLGTATDMLRLHSSYIALPLYYRLHKGAFGLRLGAQPMLFLDAHAHYSSTGTFEGQPTESHGRVDVDFRRFDWGPKIGLDYRFGKGFGLRIDYYHGIPNILEDGAGFRRQNRQLGIGIEKVVVSRKS